MKSIVKYSVLALAIAGAQQAAAEDFVLTGSTAFRSATHSALQAIMTGETISHTGSSLSSANQATFKGTIAGVSGGPHYVYCSWSGSATGVIAAAAGSNVTVITQANVDGFAANTINASQPTGGTKPARMAFSDVYKESTTAASAALTDSRPAVIPFRFVKNRLSPAFTNVTAQQMRALWTNNTVPRALFTGNAADTDVVLGVGRDNGSGTRITVLAETKYGINALVQQWKVTTTGSAGSGSSTSAQIWGISDGVGASLGEGNGGYSSGGSIATIMGMESSTVDTFEADGTTAIDTDIPVTFLAWLGLNDAATSITNGATGLTYEGVDYSPTAVYEGSYTLWGYLHLYYPAPVGSETAFRTSLTGASGLGNATVLGTNGLRFADMVASRGSDGGLVGR
jgi:hypothetical protein